jgi:hypothetical protein
VEDLRIPSPTDSETLIKGFLILQARTRRLDTTSAGNIVELLIRAIKSHGKIARRQCLSLPVALLVTCRAQRGLARAAAHTASEKGILRIVFFLLHRSRILRGCQHVIALAGTAESRREILMAVNFSAPKVIDINVAAWIGRSLEFRID